MLKCDIGWVFLFFPLIMFIAAEKSGVNPLPTNQHLEKFRFFFFCYVSFMRTPVLGNTRIDGLGGTI